MSSSDCSDIRLTDFGIARKLQGDIVNSQIQNNVDENLVRPRLFRAHTKCGSRNYVAPEVMRGGGYNTQVDMWSVGVVTHVLLSGSPPICSLSDSGGAAKIMFEGDSWEDKTECVKDFVSKLLVRCPETRMSALEALRHPWIVNQVIKS
jgi:serine/threonine protein kinase